MNPKFDNPQYFQTSGTLEMCGPTNLRQHVAYMTITRLLIADGLGHSVDKTGLNVVALRTDPMWETVLAAGQLQVGTNGSGHAEATLTMTDGTTQQIAWDGAFALIDQTTLAASVLASPDGATSAVVA